MCNNPRNRAVDAAVAISCMRISCWNKTLTSALSLFANNSQIIWLFRIKCVFLPKNVNTMTDTDSRTKSSEPAASYGTNSYSDVRNLSCTISRINHLASLRDDWDGYGASRIQPQVISNIRSVVLCSNDSDWCDWTISPNTNGTLFIQSTKRICSLSLGTHEYSFFAQEKDGRKGESHLPFNAEAFLSQMRLLNHQKVTA